MNTRYGFFFFGGGMDWGRAGLSVAQGADGIRGRAHQAAERFPHLIPLVFFGQRQLTNILQLKKKKPISE
jgi:hypothetical protein